MLIIKYQSSQITSRARTLEVQRFDKVLSSFWNQKNRRGGARASSCPSCQEGLTKNNEGH